MSKRSFITILKGTKKYQILTEDIKEVFSAHRKKRPQLPAY